MAIDEKKRQKKLAKKKAKRKSVAADRKKAEWKFGPSRELMKSAPIHECLVSRDLFEVGMGPVFLSRKMPDGEIALGSFLLDVYCLGVKNAIFTVVSESSYQEMIESGPNQGNTETIHPACARKLVEESAAYAASLGLKPHKDYAAARKVFGDLDPDACPRTFEFGKDGRPFFVSGPGDTPARCRQIIDKLTKNVGEDNFDVMMAPPEDAPLPVPPLPPPGAFEPGDGHPPQDL